MAQENITPHFPIRWHPAESESEPEAGRNPPSPGAPAAAQQPAASVPEAPGSYGSLHHGARRRLGPEGPASAPRSGPRLQPALPRARPHALGPPRVPASVAAAALVGCRDAPAPDAPLSGGRRAHDAHRARGAGGKFDVHM